MNRYIDADKLITYKFTEREANHNDMGGAYRTGWNDAIDAICENESTADVVEADKAQKEIDYWHDKAQSYEQTILKLSLNKADVVEVVRCKDCRYMTEHYDVDGNAPYWTCSEWDSGTDYDGFCSYGERADT